MRLPIWTAATVSLILAIAGCAKKSGEAVILSKEHIEKGSRLVPTEARPTASPEEPRPMADDEIAVDGIVMKREVRGTAKDPRALTSEQWLLRIRLTKNGREFNVPTEQKRWEKLKSGDRVKVKYSQGNYTGTIWAAEIEDDG